MTGPYPLTKAERRERQKAILRTFMLAFALLVGFTAGRASATNLTTMAYEREARAQEAEAYYKAIADSLATNCETAAAAGQSALEWLSRVEP